MRALVAAALAACALSVAACQTQSAPESHMSGSHVSGSHVSRSPASGSPASSAVAAPVPSASAPAPAARPAAAALSARGAAIFKDRCKDCHDPPAGDAPTRAELAKHAPNDLRQILKTGLMQPMAEGLSDDEISVLIDFLIASPAA